jgi:hypothetical protein
MQPGYLCTSVNPRRIGEGGGETISLNSRELRKSITLQQNTKDQTIWMTRHKQDSLLKGTRTKSPTGKTHRWGESQHDAYIEKQTKIHGVEVEKEKTERLCTESIDTVCEGKTSLSKQW